MEKNFFVKRVIGLVLVCASIFCIIDIPALAYDPGMEGLQYVITTDVRDKTPEWQHIAENKTSQVDTVSYNVTRKKSFTGSLSGSVEASTLVKKIKIEAEVAYGSSKSVSTTASFSIPQYSSVTCVFGSCVVKTTGMLEKWTRGKKVSSKYVYGNWTYCSYSSKYNN